MNKGVLCAKGSAGIMQVNSPARLRAPLLRTGPARLGRVPGDLLGRGARPRRLLAEAAARDRARKARLLHRARPVAELHRLLGAGLRHAQLRRPRRLLLGQHGGGRHRHHGRRLLGVRRARLGAGAAVPALRRGRGPRFATPSRSASASSRRAAPRSSASTRSAPATTPSPTTGSASRPAPTGSSRCRLVHCLMEAGRIDLDYLARFTNAPCLVNGDPRSPQNGLLLRDEEERPLVIDRRTGKTAPWNGEGVRARPLRPPARARRHPPPRPPPHGRALPVAGLRARDGGRRSPASPPPASARSPPSSPRPPSTASRW